MESGRLLVVSKIKLSREANRLFRWAGGGSGGDSERVTGVHAAACAVEGDELTVGLDTDHFQSTAVSEWLGATRDCAVEHDRQVAGWWPNSLDVGQADYPPYYLIYGPDGVCGVCERDVLVLEDFLDLLLPYSVLEIRYRPPPVCGRVRIAGGH